MSVESIPPGNRSNPRFLARIAIFHGQHQNKVLTGYSVNMSTGGVFIETRTILPEHTELTVKFKLPNTDGVIVSTALVAWVNDPLTPKKPALPPGMGLQFRDLSLEDLHAIRAFLVAGNFQPTW